MDLRNAQAEPRLLNNGIGICYEDCSITATCNYCKFDHYCYPHLHQTHLKLGKLLSILDRLSRTHNASIERHMWSKLREAVKDLYQHCGIQQPSGGNNGGV